MTFKPAVRKATHLLIGLTGQSGSGKTYSALRLARGLVGPKGRIALLDTENGRGSIYDDLTAYDVDELWAPFTPQRYAEKIKEAEAAGYDALIVDSFSHEWEGTGGVLEMADATGKQGLLKWAAPKTQHKKLMNVLLQARLHVIVCLRGKEKHVQVADPNGGNRQVILSMGTVPISEGRLLFEMTVSLIMDEEHKGIPQVRKCPDSLRAAFPDGALITEKTGEQIAEWVAGAKVNDPEFERLLAGFRSAAADGIQSMRNFYGGRNEVERERLKPYIDECKNIAEASEPISDQGPGDDKDDEDVPAPDAIDADLMPRDATHPPAETPPEKDQGQLPTDPPQDAPGTPTAEPAAYSLVSADGEVTEFESPDAAVGTFKKSLDEAGDYKYPKLAEAYQHFFGEGFSGAHSALADVRACSRIFFELKKRQLVPMNVLPGQGEQSI